LRGAASEVGTSNFVIFNDKLLQITEKNGVPFRATKTVPVQNTPMPQGTPRSELARTGEPHIDAILDDPVTKRNIDEAVINDQYDVPYSAGGSVPLHDPTMFIDRHFPRSMEVDGVRFDPAEPFTIHENVEQHVMEVLIKGGMDKQTAYKVAHFEFAEKAEGAWYRAHGIDQAKAEAAYRPYIDQIQHENPTNPPPNLYVDAYPHDDVRAAKGEPLAEPGPTKLEIAQAKEILAGEPKPSPLGAAATDMPDTPLSVEPPSPPGRSAGAAGTALDQLNGFAKNLQYLLDPMATGSNRAMVIAKDAISMVRRIRWDHLRYDRELVRDFTPESRKAMWDRADEESVALQLGEPREHLGLVTLEPKERAMVEELQARSQSAWLLARDAGIVEGDGLPAYTPRMVLNVANAIEGLGPQALNELGRNVFTRTAQMKRRGHMTAEETEAAAKELVGKRMAESGASVAEITAAQEKVGIARDIRSLALATARLEEASVWRTMINEIEMAGKSAGEPTVSVGFKPNDEWFTIAGNPAFMKWEPMLEKLQDVAGEPYWQPIRNDAGEVVFQQKPIYMHNEFKGPMTAILDEGANKSKIVQGAQSAYGALMAIKGKSMTAILNSPLIHNEVVWSKVMEAAGGREWLGFGLYWRGNRIVNNPGRAGELIERGLQPMGPRGAFQDITSMMESPDITREHPPSWTGKILAAVPNLFSETAGAKVENAIGKAGNFVHNTLLWDRVRDLQFGLADLLSDQLVAKGHDRLTADRISAHFSNIVVGSIPKESMSAAARSTANMLLFSRSFTLGNLATYKQAIMGLPKPILAQIERDFAIRALEGATPEDMAAALADVKKDAQSIARRKAAGTIALSAAFFYAGNAVFQHAFNVLSRDDTVDEETKAYARRFADLMADVSEDPFELRHLVGRMSPTYDNEPKKSDRVHIGYDKDGTAIYARLPTGKYGEEVVGYPTMPMEMLRRKLSPMASGILDILENDKGFGRKIYDENDTSAMGDVKTAFAVAKHMVMKHLPEGQINAFVDLLRGEGDPTVNKYRLFGPVFGFTASVGAPGGQARGEQLAAKQQFDARFNLAWPDIRKQVLRGDSDGAREALTGLGVPPRMQEGLIRNALNPSGALRGGTLRNFMQYSTPQQRERFERAQGRSGPPVPPEMPQIEAPQ
jgi:hypothetical protein